MTSNNDLQAIKLLLARLGVAPEDIVRSGRRLPTIGEYIHTVIAATGSGTQATYGPYWKRIVEAFGDRTLDDVAASDIETLMQAVGDDRIIRRNGRGGSSAREHLLRAARAIYRHAEDDGIIAHHENPAARVPKPHRPPSTRRALTGEELAAINSIAATTGNDAVLDSLLLRLHTETACRRGGALALRIQDIDQNRSLILLREKNHATRWQPVSPTLALALTEHHVRRVADRPPETQLLRYRDGAPISTRRYDHLWSRIGERLPWVAAQNISTHWLRHTTITWVERHFGYGIARAYAGHTHAAGPSTTTYIKASLREVATALSALTGEPHPMADA
jgi:integrase